MTLVIMTLFKLGVAVTMLYYYGTGEQTFASSHVHQNGTVCAQKERNHAVKCTSQ